MTTRTRNPVLLFVLLIIVLMSLACESGDMDRSWMTATVEAAESSEGTQTGLVATMQARDTIATRRAEAGGK